VAEEAEGLEPGAAAAGPGVDPVAVSLALGAAVQSERVAARAEAFLEKQGALSNRQSRLADLRIAEMTREDAVRHRSLRVRHISDVMKLAFEISLAFIVVALAALIATAIWTASHNDGVVVEAFNVPPDLAAKGLTGEVIASPLARES
jgi:hypothetical protein